MSDMTPEQLQHLIWGKPIVPNLPKFERHILNRYGKNISHKNEATVARNTRELNKLLNGYGKQPTKVTNPIYNKLLNSACDDRIRGIIRLFHEESSHKGQRVLQSVISTILTDYPTINWKLIQMDYGYSERHSKRYVSILQTVLSTIGHFYLDKKPSDSWEIT